jgi:hypothetical protein
VIPPANRYIATMPVKPRYFGGHNRHRSRYIFGGSRYKSKMNSSHEGRRGRKEADDGKKIGGKKIKSGAVRVIPPEVATLQQCR